MKLKTGMHYTKNCLFIPCLHFVGYNELICEDKEGHVADQKPFFFFLSFEQILKNIKTCSWPLRSHDQQTCL